MYIFKFYSYVYWSSYHVPDAVYCLNNKQNNMSLRSLGLLEETIKNETYIQMVMMSYKDKH